MTFRQGLTAARGSLLLVAAFATGLAAITMLERWQPARAAADITPSTDIPQASTRPLTERERYAATVAWRYFERNTRPETGLADSAEQYPASTLWDTGSYLMAVLSAHRLGLIGAAEVDARLTAALRSLARIPLFDGHAPNKSYNTLTLAMVDYNNQSSSRGIGWSAIDVGRMLVPLTEIVWRFPAHVPAVQAVLTRWHFQRIVRDGVLYGAVPSDTGTTYVQEGRLGYEEYGAKAFSLAGLDVHRALRIDDFLLFVDADGVQVATDSRRPEEYHAHNYVVSEPYILDGLEFGFDNTSRELAWRVEQAQEAHARVTGRLVAVSEDNLDRAPYFVYNTVFTNGRLWNAVTSEGADASAFKTISVKAAFGWQALYDRAYTRQLVDKVYRLHDPGRGWFAGEYDATGEPNAVLTANTNAIVLESLAYRQTGRLLRPF